MRIAAYQGRCRDGDVAATLRKTLEVFEEAARRGADFLLLPEAFLSGYGDRQTVTGSALALEDRRLLGLVAATERHDLVLLVGVNERQGEAVYNTELVIHRGRLL